MKSLYRLSMLLVLLFLMAGCMMEPAFNSKPIPLQNADADKHQLQPYSGTFGRLNLVFNKAPGYFSEQQEEGSCIRIPPLFLFVYAEGYALTTFPFAVVNDTFEAPDKIETIFSYEKNTGFWKEYLAGKPCDDPTFKSYLTAYCRCWIGERLKTATLRDEQLLQLIRMRLYLSTLAERPGLSVPVASALYEEAVRLRQEETGFWGALTRNKDCRENEMPGTSHSDQTFDRIVSNETFPSEILVRMAREGNLEKRFMRNLARNPRLSGETLRTLAKTCPSDVARNPSTPADVLRALALQPETQYDGFSIPENLACNPNLPVEAALSILHSNNNPAIHNLFENRKLSPEILTILIDSKPAFGLEAIRYPQATAELIAKVYSQPGGTASPSCFLAAPNCPASVLLDIVHTKIQSLNVRRDAPELLARRSLTKSDLGTIRQEVLNPASPLSRETKDLWLKLIDAEMAKRP
jgi:hypothetical protein